MIINSLASFASSSQSESLRLGGARLKLEVFHHDVDVGGDVDGIGVDGSYMKEVTGDMQDRVESLGESLLWQVEAARLRSRS